MGSATTTVPFPAVSRTAGIMSIRALACLLAIAWNLNVLGWLLTSTSAAGSRQRFCPRPPEWRPGMRKKRSSVRLDNSVPRVAGSVTQSVLGGGGGFGSGPPVLSIAAPLVVSTSDPGAFSRRRAPRALSKILYPATTRVMPANCGCARIFLVSASLQDLVRRHNPNFCSTIRFRNGQRSAHTRIRAWRIAELSASSSILHNVPVDEPG